MKLTEQHIQEEAEQHAAIARGGSITALQESAFTAGAEWALEQDPWISVEERLPEEVGYYLCFDFKNVTGPVIAGFFGGLWIPNIGKAIQITHWMPLPNPPKQ